MLAACLRAVVPAVVSELGVRVPMRDGVELSTNVFRPAGLGPFATILVRTPYNKSTKLAPHYRVFLDRGFALVIQDVRGRFASGGHFAPLRQETADGDDTLNWIARQPWSNRRIGMMGGSYLGIAQWKAALTNNPYLKAIFAGVCGADDYMDRFYSSGGALKLGQRLEWMSQNLRRPGVRKPDFREFVHHLPLRTADVAATGRRIGFFRAALDHPAYDAFWKELSTLERIDEVRVPVFTVAGWFDNFVESDLEAFRRLREKGRRHRIVVGPWPHNVGGHFPGIDFGPEAHLALRQLQLEWFHYWLQLGAPDGGRSVANPPIRIFVMGDNRWRDEEEWPIRRAREVRFYLSSGGRANTLDGDGTLARVAPVSQPPDEFVYDPSRPVPTAGGAACCNPRVLAIGPLDQRAVERRADVLVYTSPALDADLEVTGPVRAALYVATSAPDTDFTAKLVDVFPSGEARLVTDGILRLRYRESIRKAVLAGPGEVYQIAIDAGVTSNVFAKGHRIRLEVSSSNFPRFDRNPNTGRPIADETELRPASQTVFHDRVRPSHLVLPVVPRNVLVSDHSGR